MLDMSTAFDVVDHDILLSKLELYGFDGEALKWMENYLSGRTQSVYIDGSFSVLILSCSSGWCTPRLVSWAFFYQWSA